MDQRSADHYMIDQTANNRSHNLLLKKTLQIMVPISVISFLVSYFSVLPLLFFHPLQFYSSIIPFMSQALDRKCMFLICNAILAFLANNLKLHYNSPLHHATKTFEEDDAPLLFRGNDLDFHADAAVHDQQADGAVAGEIEREEEEWEEEEDYDDDDDEVEDVENSPSATMEDVDDMRVSTEDLNKKFDEFIRKMKEEIRIEARQQHLILV